jgi:glucose dehydrogenase
MFSSASVRTSRLARRALAALLLPATAAPAADPVLLDSAAFDAQWSTTLGDPGGQSRSPLDTIVRSNVGRLAVRWTYRHPDFRSGWPETQMKGTAFEATPILARGRLNFSTPPAAGRAATPARTARSICCAASRASSTPGSTT